MSETVTHWLCPDCLVRTKRVDLVGPIGGWRCPDCLAKAKRADLKGVRAMVKRYWAAMCIYPLVAQMLTLINEADPARRPDYFIPVFRSRRQAIAWIGNEDEVVEVTMRTRGGSQEG